MDDIMANEIYIDGLDIVDVIDFMDKKKRKFIAMALTSIEESGQFSSNGPEYNLVRKVILDNFNDYTRSILRVLFGDIEGLTMK